eukprot:3392181-Prymnesium_polylepis.1
MQPSTSRLTSSRGARRLNAPRTPEPLAVGAASQRLIVGWCDLASAAAAAPAKKSQNSAGGK